MFGSFRAAMTWVHTWFGLVLGYVLVVVFFFGSLSVFDREIDRWAIPETRFAPQRMPSFEAVIEPSARRIVPDPEAMRGLEARHPGRAPTFRLTGASAYRTARDPVLTIYADLLAVYPDGSEEKVEGEATIDPRTGRELPKTALEIGTRFFYPMHICLQLRAANLGYWLVGLAGLGMLIGLVSGVVIHRRLFLELFTFRPREKTRRATLDLHNLTGVVALPFHLVFALSGLVIFAGIYLPVSETVLKPLADRGEAREATARGFPREPAGVPGQLASVDGMVAEAERRWSARGVPGEVGYLVVRHLGDAGSSVSVHRAGKDRVTMFAEGVHFEGPTGRVLSEDPRPGVVGAIAGFLTAVHLQPFEHWGLRWLYVLGGLAGCTCIATGMVFFVARRKQKHASLAIGGARWADSFAVATVTGTLVATLSILVANRALPADLLLRAAWQERLFWIAWGLAFLHAAWRSRPVGAGLPSPAWSEQCFAVAGLAVAAFVLNATTTGDHLVATLARRYWPVAGVDMVLVATALVAALSGRRLRLRAETSE